MKYTHSSECYLVSFTPTIVFLLVLFDIGSNSEERIVQLTVPIQSRFHTIDNVLLRVGLLSEKSVELTRVRRGSNDRSFSNWFTDHKKKKERERELLLENARRREQEQEAEEKRRKEEGKSKTKTIVIWTSIFVLIVLGVCGSLAWIHFCSKHSSAHYTSGNTIPATNLSPHEDTAAYSPNATQMPIIRPSAPLLPESPDEDNPPAYDEVMGGANPVSVPNRNRHKESHF